jgi:hypothetical protein
MYIILLWIPYQPVVYENENSRVNDGRDRYLSKESTYGIVQYSSRTGINSRYSIHTALNTMRRCTYMYCMYVHNIPYSLRQPTVRYIR